MAVATLSVAACEEPEKPVPVVARWRTGQVLVEELQAELARLRREASAEARPSAAEVESLRRTTLDALVDHRLLLAEALARGVTVNEAEVDDALRRRHGTPRWTYRPPIGPVRPPAEDDRPMPDKDDLRRRTREQLLVEALLVRETVARVAVAPDEVQKHYERHIDRYSLPERVRCSQIVVPTRGEAEAVRREYLRTPSFEKLARIHSTAPERNRGGDLGFVLPGSLPPVLHDACTSLRRGQVSDVVESPYGFHLFTVTETKAGSVRPLAEVEAEIEQGLRRDRVRDLQQAFVEKLRKANGVVVDAALLATVEWPSSPLPVSEGASAGGEGRPSVDPPAAGVGEVRE